jgi:uncharacterized protein YbjT (DUF2867 family)
MKPLVIGGTGMVGSRVVAELLRRDAAPRCLTHSKEKIASLPKGVEGAVGNLDQPETLPEAFAGVDSLFLLVALSPAETAQGLAAVEAAKKAGLRRIVYMSVVLPPDSHHIPHFASKIPIEAAVRTSGLAWTILRPNNFFQNDDWLQQALQDYGVYPTPIGSVGVSRVDVRDIADAAANALLGDGHGGQTYPVCGPDAMTGDETAKVWARRLGREVRYLGDDLDAWAREAGKMMPAGLVEDLVIMWDYFQKKGLRASEADLALQAKGIGHPPRSFDAYAGEMAAAWKRS